MVKYALSQPLLASEFGRLVNLDTSRLSSPEGLRRCADVEASLLAVVEYMGDHLRSHRETLPVDIDRPQRWAGVSESAALSGLLKAIDGELRNGSFSDDPALRVSAYEHIVHRLLQPRVELMLGDDAKLEELLQAYRYAKYGLQHLLGYEVDYAGGLAAQMLARIHHGLCPAEIEAICDEPLKSIGYGLDRTFEVEQPCIEDIRNAVSEVHALLDAFLDERAAKHYLINRLAAYFQLYASARVFSEADALAEDESSKVEEHVFHPVVDEFLFNYGYYPLSEVQLGRDRVRPDILSLAPEHDAWFLCELKQSGFGKRTTTRGDVERKLREAVAKAARYHELLAPLPTVQPDVYVVCFVKGVADFVRADGGRMGYWHEISQQGIQLHIRLVNIPAPGDSSPTLLIRTATLDKTNPQGAE
jgi:hypothetical protein